MEPPKFEVCFTPKSGHSEAHAGLLLVTHKRHFASMDSPVIGLDVQAGTRWPAVGHGITELITFGRYLSSQTTDQGLAGAQAA
jgi:hypothetical protein